VSHALLDDPKFLALLLRIDQDLAAQMRADEHLVHLGLRARLARHVYVVEPDVRDHLHRIRRKVEVQQAAAVTSSRGSDVWNLVWCVVQRLMTKLDARSVQVTLQSQKAPNERRWPGECPDMKGQFKTFLSSISCSWRGHVGNLQERPSDLRSARQRDDTPGSEALSYWSSWLHQSCLTEKGRANVIHVNFHVNPSNLSEGWLVMDGRMHRLEL